MGPSPLETLGVGGSSKPIITVARVVVPDPAGPNCPLEADPDAALLIAPVTRPPMPELLFQLENILVETAASIRMYKLIRPH